MKALMVCWIFSAIFLPELVGNIRVDDIILLIIIVWLLLVKNVHFKLYGKPLLILLFYFSILSLSALYNLMIHNEISLQATMTHFIHRENIFIKELYRALKYFLIVIIIANLNYTVVDKQKLIQAFIYFSFLISCLGILQYFDLFGINAFIMSNYAEGNIHNVYLTQDYIASGHARIHATFYNSNVYGAFLLIPIALVTVKIVYANKLIYCIPLLTLWINVFLTQSRTTIIVAGVISLLILLHYLYKKSVIHLKHLIIGSILILSTPFILHSLNLSRFEHAFTIDNMIGVNGREFALNMLHETLQKSPIVGFSPMMNHIYPFDNELYNFAFYGGLIGILFYLLFIIGLGICVAQANKQQLNMEEKTLLYALICIIPLVGVSNGFIFSNRVFPFFIVLVSLLFYGASPKIEIKNYLVERRVKA